MKGKRTFYRVILSVLLISCFALCIPREACASKYIRVYRDGNFDIYVNTATLITNQGVVSFSVKRVCSHEGQALVRKEMPAKLKKATVDFVEDYISYNTKTGKYQVKICRVYETKGQEIFKQGSQKWLPLKENTIASAVINKVLEYKEEKGK